MRFEVLGPLRMHQVAVSGALRRSLLAMLLARASKPVPVDVLVGARYEQARAYEGLGDIHERQGESGQTIELWAQALAIYRDLRAPKTAEPQEKITGLG